MDLQAGSGLQRYAADLQAAKQKRGNLDSEFKGLSLPLLCLRRGPQKADRD